MSDSFGSPLNSIHNSKQVAAGRQAGKREEKQLESERERESGRKLGIPKEEKLHGGQIASNWTAGTH